MNIKLNLDVLQRLVRQIMSFSDVYTKVYVKMFITKIKDVGLFMAEKRMETNVIFSSASSICHRNK